MSASNKSYHQKNEAYYCTYRGRLNKFTQWDLAPYYLLKIKTQQKVLAYKPTDGYKIKMY